MLKKILYLLLFFVWATKVAATEEIVLGSVLPLNGPSADLGLGLKNGYSSYLKIWNEDHGKKIGYKINVISRDDRYEPNLTFRETLKLTRDEKVFAFFSHVGTPTTESIKDFLVKEKNYLFGLFSGARMFREANQKNIFHLRASYEEEIERLVNYYAKNQQRKFFIVHQADSFGGSGKALVTKLLEKKNMFLIGQTSYERNKLLSEKSVKELAQLAPHVTFFIGTYAPLANLIKEARKVGYKGEFATISFIGTKGLKEALGSSQEEVTISQVVPNPQNRSLELVRHYQDVMKKNGFKKYDYGSLEGYLYARVFTHYLESYLDVNKKTLNGTKINREEFFQGLRQFKTKIDGVAIDFSNSKQVAYDQVFLVKIKNGKNIDLE